MAQKVDQQVQGILASIELRPEWREEMARLAVTDKKGPDPKALAEKLRGLDRVYRTGRFCQAVNEAEEGEILAQLQSTNPIEPPTLEEPAKLFGDIPQIWEDATPAERRNLLSQLIERVYVDMEHSMIGAFVPVPLHMRRDQKLPDVWMQSRLDAAPLNLLPRHLRRDSQ